MSQSYLCIVNSLFEVCGPGAIVIRLPGVDCFGSPPLLAYVNSFITLLQHNKYVNKCTASCFDFRALLLLNLLLLFFCFTCLAVRRQLCLVTSVVIDAEPELMEAVIPAALGTCVGGSRYAQLANHSCRAGPTGHGPAPMPRVRVP